MDVFGIASGLTSAGLNLINQRSVNNEARRQFEENLNWQKYQYEDSKKYNSAKSQVQRLRAAGLNPMLAFGQGAGESTPISGSSPTAQQGAADISPAIQAGNGMVSALSQSSLNKKQGDNLEADTNVKEAEGQLKWIDTFSRHQENLQRIENMLSEKDLNDERRAFLEKQKASLLKDMEFQHEKNEWNNHILRLEAENKALQNQAQQLNIKFLPMLSQAQCNQLLSIAYLNYESGKTEGKKRDLLVQQTISELIHSGILGNDFFKGLPEGLKGKELYKALMNNPKYKALTFALQNTFDTFGRIIPFAGR